MVTVMDPESWGVLAMPRIPCSCCSPDPKTCLLTPISLAAHPQRGGLSAAPARPTSPEAQTGFSPRDRLTNHEENDGELHLSA